jgi:phosphopentomutase
MISNRRVILIVMDSVGIGAMPDAAKYDDEGASTLNHISQYASSLSLPNLCKIGLSNIAGVRIDHTEEKSCGAYARAAELSAGKDTITGHWEIAGLVTETPFKTFTDTGFPDYFIKEFEKNIGRKIIGNISASGTEIIKEYGELHKKTGRPIVYTSADSVFQVAADVSVIPLEELYDICRKAREMLTGDLLVGRVIARPFITANGEYIRTCDRRDYAVDPFGRTILDEISESGYETCAVGKITDIFNGKGITSSVHTKDNNDGIDKTLAYMKNSRNGLIFTNLVDFDAKYGHRRDVEGYARSLEQFDKRLPEVIEKMRTDDILMICADHGNDPIHKGWNHTREYVPVLVYGNNIAEDRNLGTLDSFADIGATVSDYLHVKSSTKGKSFLSSIQEKI